MASHFAILSAFLLFTSSIPGTPNPSTFVQPPPGISLTVLSFDTNSCFQSTPNVTFIEQGNELSIGYANFGAWTTPGQGAYDKMCSITLQVSYPTGYQFYVHDPDFQGNSTAEDQGAAFFTAYSYFGSNIILAQADRDQAELGDRYVGSYIRYANSSEIGDGTRKFQAPCGAAPGGSANLTVITRIDVLNGMAPPDRVAAVTILPQGHSL